MSDIVQYLCDKSLEDLEVLRDRVVSKIRELQSAQDTKELQDEVEAKGFAIRSKPIQDPGNLHHMELLYYFLLKESDEGYMEISSVHTCQPEWVKAFDFKYELTGDETYEILSGEDKDGDMKGDVVFHLYFPPHPCPDDGTTFRCRCRNMDD